MIEVKTTLKGGFLEQPGRVGAMLDFGNIKAAKLEARRERYKNGEYNFAALYDYLNGELKELQEAWLDGNDPRALLRELADASNCIDMMAFCLIGDGAR